MKVGDPVRVHFDFKASWITREDGCGEGVFFVKAVDMKTAQLAQEVWPFSHFSYVDISSLRPAEFTAEAHKDMWKLRDQAMIRSANDSL